MSYLPVRLVPAAGPEQSDPEARPPIAAGEPLEFSTLYDAWFDQVLCWLRALGAPRADLEDLAQEVFLVVRRRLPSFDGRSLGAWLFQISRRQVWRHRRLQWVKRIFTASSLGTADDLPHAGASPLAQLETKERQRILEQLLSRLSEKHRVVFVLFEIEGRPGEEIAETLDVPINTVWTRLRRARKDFFRLVANHEQAESKEEK
jgi:RNA polymerase sigma-70 factor (ECF subfamily)